LHIPENILEDTEKDLTHTEDILTVLWPFLLLIDSWTQYTHLKCSPLGGTFPWNQVKEAFFSDRVNGLSKILQNHQCTKYFIEDSPLFKHYRHRLIQSTFILQVKSISNLLIPAPPSFKGFLKRKCINETDSFLI